MTDLIVSGGAVFQVCPSDLALSSDHSSMLPMSRRCFANHMGSFRDVVIQPGSTRIRPGQPSLYSTTIMAFYVSHGTSSDLLAGQSYLGHDLDPVDLTPPRQVICPTVTQQRAKGNSCHNRVKGHSGIEQG